jgi:hypothetical protein
MTCVYLYILNNTFLHARFQESQLVQKRTVFQFEYYFFIKIDSSIMTNQTHYYYILETLIHTIWKNNAQSYRVIYTTVWQMRTIDKQLIKL